MSTAHSKPWCNTTYRLLLVEDNPGDARLLSELLKDVLGFVHDITHATSLSEGLSHAARGAFDAALLDLQLPDSSNIGTVRSFRQANPTLPIVVLTGADDEKLGMMALAGGAQDYVVKGTADGALLARAIKYACERQRAEMALREAEGKLNAIVSSSTDAVVVSDHQGTILFANAVAEKLMGAIGDGLVGTSLPQSFVTPTGDQVELVGSDGAKRLGEVRTGAFEWGGEPAYLHTVREVTARAAAARALRESEERFRALWDAVEVGMILIERDTGRIADANPAATRLYGGSRDELVGTMCTESICSVEKGRCPVVDAGLKLDRAEGEIVTIRGKRVPVLTSVIELVFGEKTYLLESFVDISELKRIERALSESENRFRAFFEHAPEYCYMVAPDGKILDVNAAALEVLGYAREELLGREVLELYTPDSRERARAMLAASYELGTINNEEMEVLCRGGGVRTVLLSSSALRDEQGKMLHSVTIQRDITDRKRSQEREYHLASVLKAIRNVNQVITRETDPRKLIQSICDRLLDARGYNTAWIILDQCSHWGTPAATAGGSEQLRVFVEQSARIEPPACARWGENDADIRIVESVNDECDGCPIQRVADTDYAAVVCRLAHDGVTYGSLCVSLDRRLSGDREEIRLLEEVVDDIAFALHSVEQREARIAAERRDRKHSRDLEFLARSAMDFVRLTDDMDPYVLVAERIRTIVGEKAVVCVCEWGSHEKRLRIRAVMGLGARASAVEKCVGAKIPGMEIPVSEVIGDQLYSGRVQFFDREVVDGIFEEAFSGVDTNQLLEILDFDCMRAAGFVRENSLYGALFVFYRDSEVYFDVSLLETFLNQATVAIERHKSVEGMHEMQSQLRHAQKMEAIGVLAGGIAHDFNNILGAIGGYTELTMEQLDKDSRAHHNLTQVAAAAARAADLVRQILTFSRQTKSEKRPLDIKLIVKEALKLLRPSLPATIEIRQHIESANNLVLADPTRIHQVLMNLCTNAAHAMSSGHGTLSVTLRQVEIGSETVPELPNLSPGRHVQLSVGDTGTGIEPAVREHIFEPFFTTKNLGEGTGMGLSVVHGIVREHGGDVQVKSMVGAGSTFVVYLPVAPTNDGSHVDTVFAEALGGNERILFVDDEQLLVSLGEEVLADLGYTVQGFSDSESALEAFKAEPEAFDLLVTDLTMPRMTGVQLAEACKAIRPELPVILSTGYTGEIARAARSHGVISELIEKPLSRRSLATAVREVLGAHPRG